MKELEEFEIVILQNINIQKFKSKFGGNPDWVKDIEWPLSKETNKPMMFVGQFNLRDIGFTDAISDMAYFFITDDTDGCAETWDANSGENAIILQTGTGTNILNIEKGPSIYQMVNKSNCTFLGKIKDFLNFRTKILEPVEVEYGINFREISNEEKEKNKEIFLNKIGGYPSFLQNEEYPDNDEKRMLLFQIDSTNIPFYLNFGDGGIGYGFINDMGTKAKFLWQC